MKKVMEKRELPLTEPPDHQLLQGILDNNLQILDRIYARYLPDVLAMVKNNRGSTDDARDVFQEAIVVLFKKASEPGFALTTTFGGYLFGVSRFIWMRQLKKKYRTEVTLEEDMRHIDHKNIETLLVESEKRQLFQQKLAQLGADCREVLQLFFAGKSLKDIALKKGYTEDYVKKKNKTCKEKLAALVREDPRYRELKEDKL